MRFTSTALALILMVAAVHAQELSPPDRAKIVAARTDTNYYFNAETLGDF